MKKLMPKSVAFDVFLLYDEVNQRGFYEVHVIGSPTEKQFSNIEEVYAFIQRITKNKSMSKAKVNFDFRLREIYA